MFGSLYAVRGRDKDHAVIVRGMANVSMPPVLLVRYARDMYWTNSQSPVEDAKVQLPENKEVDPITKRISAVFHVQVGIDIRHPTCGMYAVSRDDRAIPGAVGAESQAFGMEIREGNVPLCRNLSNDLIQLVDSLLSISAGRDRVQDGDATCTKAFVDDLL